MYFYHIVHAMLSVAMFDAIDKAEVVFNNDTKLALLLAGRLEKNMGINVFLDEVIWGSDLLISFFFYNHKYLHLYHLYNIHRQLLLKVYRTYSCARGGHVDYRSCIEFECEKAIKDNIEIIVLYNAATIDKNKCPDIIKNYGKHVAMCYRKDGRLYWDYNAVKNAIG